MAMAAAKPEVFTRKSSGLVRVMSPYSAFVYNILTMGLIFPWTYLWAPGALPGGRLVWGILLAMIFEIPIALTYVWLSTALPRSGGDYVFQSRVFGGGVGFAIVMSGFVIWILQWVALSGWLLSYLGFASLFLGLGGTMGNPTLTSIGVWFTTPWAIIIVSILNALLAMLLLVSGFKNYVKFQYVMWYATLLSFGLMLYLFFTATPETFAQKLDAFVVASGGAPNFYETAIAAAKAANIDLNPPFSLLATLLVAPIAWTSLQWATYSAEQNGEIKGARSFQNQLVIILGSLIATGVLLAILAAAFEHAIGTDFLYVAGAGYWAGLEQGKFNGVFLWPNIVAMALAGSPIIVVLIALGYILNAFQIVNNCYIGMTRVMVAMSLDRLLPEWVSRVSDKFHTPVNAHICLLPRQHPGDSGLQFVGPVDGADARRHVRLRLRVRRHRARRRADAVPRQGALRRLAGRGLQARQHSAGHDLRRDRRHRGRRHGADVHVLQRARAHQCLGVSGRVRRACRVDHLVFPGQNGPALARHQRRLCLQGDTAGIG